MLAGRDCVEKRSRVEKSVEYFCQVNISAATACVSHWDIDIGHKKPAAANWLPPVREFPGSKGAVARGAWARLSSRGR